MAKRSKTQPKRGRRKTARNSTRKRKATAQPSSRKQKLLQERRLRHGLRLLRKENSVAAAAHKVGIEPARLRAHAIRKKLLVKRGKRWVVEKDISRQLLIYSDGKESAITVAKFRTASRIGEYMAGVRWFVQTNDLRHLEPFVGKSVTDVTGKRHLFETRPNVLHRLANSGGSSFEDVYRLVI